MARLEKRSNIGAFLAKLVLKIVGRMNRVDSGTINFSRGQHELFVASQCNRGVWIKIKDRGAGVCGGGNRNKVGYAPAENGIIFYADIETDSCEVRWFATRVHGRHAFDIELTDDELAKIYE